MLETTTRVPTAIHIRIVLPILIVKSLNIWLRVVHAVKADPIEVALRNSLGLKHDGVPVLVATALAVGHMRVLGSVEAVGDVLD